MAINTLANLADIRAYTQVILESEAEGQQSLWPPEIIDGFINSEHDFLVAKLIHASEGFFRRASTADIVANQEYYALPADFRMLHLLERRTAAGENSWTELRPLDAPRRRQEHHLPLGVGVSSGGSTIRSLIRRRAGAGRYYLLDNYIVMVPFFNEAMTAGLRLWYDYQPTPATDDLWVPFSSLLRGHHEILAVGAAIRCKKREELPDFYTDWYQSLYDNLIDAVEERVKQERKHGADLEGYYG